MSGNEANQKTMSGNPSVRKNLDTIETNFWSTKIAKTVWQTTLDYHIHKSERAQLGSSMPNFRNNQRANGWGSNASQTPVNPKLRNPEAQLGFARGSQDKLY